MLDIEREIPYDIPYVWNLKRNDTDELTYKTETDSQTQKTNLQLPRGRDRQGVWDGHGHTAIFKMGNQQGPLYRALLNVMWQPGWEGSLGENGYTCMYG